jgi:hypothetical protein
MKCRVFLNVLYTSDHGLRGTLLIEFKSAGLLYSRTVCNVTDGTKCIASLSKECRSKCMVNLKKIFQDNVQVCKHVIECSRYDPPQI